MFFSQCMLEHHQELTHTHKYKMKGLSTLHFQLNQMKNGQTANICLCTRDQSQKGKGSAIILWGPQGKGNFLQTQYRTAQIMHTSNKGNP